jgi:hypothetical protein
MRSSADPDKILALIVVAGMRGANAGAVLSDPVRLVTLESRK